MLNGNELLLPSTVECFILMRQKNTISVSFMFLRNSHTSTRKESNVVLFVKCHP